MIVRGTEMLPHTRAGIQRPGSSLRRSLKLSIKTKGGESIPSKLIRIGRWLLNFVVSSFFDYRVYFQLFRVANHDAK